MEAAVVERVGLVTIGQSPRDDIVPGFLVGLGRPVELVQSGALDGLNAGQVAALAPRPGEYVLVTRMNDGRPVTVGRERLLPFLEAAIGRLEQSQVGLIVLLCTGTFPGLRPAAPLLEPDRLVMSVVQGLLATGRLGVVTPLPEQIPPTRERWSVHWTVSVEAALPYGEAAQIDEAAGKLRAFQPDLVILDCLGFTPGDGRRTREILKVPVIVPQTIIGRVAAEVLGM